MMNGQRMIGFMVTMAILILIGAFLITLLPYILFGLLLVYVYRQFIRPIFSQKNEQTQEYKSYQSSYERSDVGEDPLADQVKSVHDDSFFKKEHKVIDVDYDDDTQ